MRKLRIVADRKCDKFDIPKPVNNTIVDPAPELDITNTVEKLPWNRDDLE